MAHGVHGVMRLMAVHRPIAGFIGDEFDGAHLPDRDISGDLRPGSSLRDVPTIRSSHDEFMAVNVDRMIGHREISDPHTHLVVLCDDEVVDPRKRAAVPGPEIEFEHRHDLRHIRARLDIKGVKQECIITIGAPFFWVFWMHDEHSHHAHRHLHHFIGVRMIHVSARASQLELVDEGFTWLDVRLSEAADAVHAVGKPLSVPMDSCVFRQLVGDKNTDLVTFNRFYGWAGRLTVVAP